MTLTKITNFTRFARLKNNFNKNESGHGIAARQTIDTHYSIHTHTYIYILQMTFSVFQYRLRTWEGNPVAIFLTGLISGYVTFFPMMMMSDSGTRLALTAATMGMYGCILLFVGGIVGALVKRWTALLPGAILAMSAIAVLTPSFSIVPVILLGYCLMPVRKKPNEALLNHAIDGDVEDTSVPIPTID
jgi:hypothetical protein